MIGTVPAPVLISDPADPRVADFRDLVAGDRRPGTPRGTGLVIVEGVPAVEQLLPPPPPRPGGLGGGGGGAAARLAVPGAGGVRGAGPGGRPGPAGRRAGVRGGQVGALGGDR